MKLNRNVWAGGGRLRGILALRGYERLTGRQIGRIMSHGETKMRLRVLS